MVKASSRLGRWEDAAVKPKGSGSQGSCIKIAVILRRRDARWAKVAGIAQPKNPVSPRRCFCQSVLLIHRPASHEILHCASARHLRPHRCSVQDDFAFLLQLPCSPARRRRMVERKMVHGMHSIRIRPPLCAHEFPRSSARSEGEHRWMLDVGRWMLDVGCWTLDVGRWMFSSCVFREGKETSNVQRPTSNAQHPMKLHFQLSVHPHGRSEKKRSSSRRVAN